MVVLQEIREFAGPNHHNSGKIEQWLTIRFQLDGQVDTFSIDLPDGWSEWTREERIEWSLQQIAEYLEDSEFGLTGVVYPDVFAPEQAIADFESLPGWSTWTAEEAEGWIEDNVTNLTSAKTALKALATIVVYLRDINLRR